MNRGDLIRGNLDTLLLAVVASGPKHGYAILEALRGHGELFDMAPGTIYPALRRLEAKGLVASAWAEGPGRPRRVYTLTKRGRSVLEAGQREWASFAATVEAILRGAPWPYPA